MCCVYGIGEKMEKVKELREYIEIFFHDEDYRNGVVIIEKTATYIAVFLRGLVKRVVISLTEREATPEEWTQFLREVENFEKKLEKMAAHVNEKDEVNAKVRKFFLSPPEEEERKKKIAVVWYTADEYSTTYIPELYKLAKIRVFDNAEEMLRWMLERYEEWVIENPSMEEEKYLNNKGYNDEDFILLRLIMYNDYIE